VVADAQRFAHVVVGDQHADVACLQEADDALDFAHGDRVHAGERFVEQDEARRRRQRARDFHAAALAARQRQRRVVAQVGDLQVVEQRVEPAIDFRLGSGLPLTTCSSSTARMFSSTLSLRKTEASCGR
jgi:hypothetical protein